MPTFTPAGDPFLVNTTTVRDQDEAAIAELAGDGFVIVWRSQGGGTGLQNVRGQRFDANGDRVGGEFQISPASQVAPLPGVTALSNGGFVVTWTAGTVFERDTLAQIYDAAGVKVGGAFQADPTGSNDSILPAVTALPNGAFVISWLEPNPERIRLQIFDSAGNKSGNARTVAPIEVYEYAQTAMTTLAGGNFVVAWLDDDLWSANLYTRNGGLVSSFSIDSDYKRGAPSVTALANGGYAFAWIELSGGNAVFKVQRFASTGATDGPAIVVSTNLTSDSRPSVLGLADGSLVAVWADRQVQPFTSDDALLGKVFDSNGVQDGDTFVVSPSSFYWDHFNFYGSPKLAATSDGGFAVTWGGSSSGDTSGAAVLARKFDVVRRPPVAVDDVVGATEDQTAIIAAAALTGNDSDPDGDTFAITGVSNPLHGSVVLNGNGTVSFTPDADFNGAARFDYTVEDLAGNPAKASVTVNVAAVNDAPRNLAFDGIVLGTAANGTLAGTISAFDVDGDAIGYALTDDAGGRFAIDADSGAVSVANIALFDFATVDAYRISAVATDSFGAASPETDLIVTLGQVLGGATSGDDRLTARSDRNWYINGLAGNDTLVGRLGDDRLIGGPGDDYYYLRNRGDVVVERANQGHDTVRAYVDFVLPANVEDLQLVSGAAHVGTGNGLDNHLSARSGADTLTGLAGDDRLDGWAGSDVLDGGSGDDRPIGGDGNDTMLGGDGNDRLEGQAGIDTLNGGVGTDVLIGGAGRDIMSGGLGADLFTFHDGDFGGSTTSTADRILDFSAAEGDRFHLSAVDSRAGTAANDAFTFIGAAAFGGMAGQLRTFQQAGDTFFAGDTNGDRAADFMVRVVGTHTLTAGSFVL